MSSAPLAPAAGNALEVEVAIGFLTGREVDSRLWDVVTGLGGEALALGGLAGSAAKGRAHVAAALESGRAAEVFGRMVAALGGPSDLVEAPARHLARAPVVEEVLPDAAGFVASIDTRALGVLVVELGGGRRVASDTVDPAVGLDWLAGAGAYVDGETPLARVHARDGAAAERAAGAVRQAYTAIEPPPAEIPVILGDIR